MVDKSTFLAVAGNIGSGKTTLTEKLADHFGFKAHFESVSDNPYLEDFYKDMPRWSFALQVYFLNHRFLTHQGIEKEMGGHIQDRSIYEDAHIFARSLFEQKLMAEREYENYLSLFFNMTKFVSPPRLMICLERSVPKLMDRIRLRARSCEDAISVDYISHLNQFYQEWYARYDLGPKLVIKTDYTDFLNSKEDFNSLVDQIEKELKKTENLGQELKI